MLKRMKPLFTWENMKRDMLIYVKQCDSCQKNKIWPANRMPMKITTTSHEPFNKIFMDVVMLPVSWSGDPRRFITIFNCCSHGEPRKCNSCKNFCGTVYSVSKNCPYTPVRKFCSMKKYIKSYRSTNYYTPIDAEMSSLRFCNWID